MFCIEELAGRMLQVFGRETVDGENASGDGKNVLSELSSFIRIEEVSLLKTDWRAFSSLT